MTGIAQHIDDMKRRHEHAVRVQVTAASGDISSRKGSIDIGHETDRLYLCWPVQATYNWSKLPIINPFQDRAVDLMCL